MTPTPNTTQLFHALQQTLVPVAQAAPPAPLGAMTLELLCAVLGGFVAWLGVKFWRSSKK